jgi:hypothetical protein
MARKRIVQVVFGVLMFFVGVGQCMRGLRELGVVHGEMEVVTAATSHGFENLAPVGAASVFAPTDTPIHFVVGIRDGVAGTPIAATWYVHLPNEPSRQLFTDSAVLPGGDTTMNFTLTNTQPWPAGDYRVDLSLAGQLVRSVPFLVQ